MRLENKVALITGGARGIGASQAKLFAHEGAKVVIADVLDAEGRQTEAEINETGGECLFVRLDVTDEANWQDAIAATVARFGKLDILVNNAGIYIGGRVEDTSVETWDQLFGVNAKGVFLGTKYAIPEMRSAGGGSIINVSSVMGLVGSMYSAAYNASKGAARLLTKAAAIQYAKEGIRVNSIHPGVTDTPMVSEVAKDETFQRIRLARNPISRLGQPEDIAYGTLYLASDESAFVTGTELVIDGGWTAQ